MALRADRDRSFADRDRSFAGTFWLWTAAVSSLVLGAAPSHAATAFFTSRAAFLAALGAPPVVVDFEAGAPGTSLPTGAAFEGVTFDYAFDHGFQLEIVSNFDTTSGANALGIDDPGNFDQLLDGDEIDFGLPGPTTAFGLSLVSGDVLLAGDVEIQTASGNAPNGGVVDQVLPDGGLAYFIGLISDDAFDEALLRFDGGDNFFFNLDDLTYVVPEPGGLPWLVLVALAGWRWRGGRRETIR